MAIQVQTRQRPGTPPVPAPFIDKNPAECPVCRVSITPIDLSIATQISGRGTPDIVERVFQCPNEVCEHFFLARYRQVAPQGAFLLTKCFPMELVAVPQSDIIKRISPDFCSIYEQAHKAEQNGLELVAGPGYRKALEFLIKDYIISGFTEKDEALAAKKATVEKTLLGNCIATYIKSEQIKEIAKRAAWLGNDETHYVRKWEDKDLKDLKKSISLTLHWIEMETLTGEVIATMPEGKT
jgi:hypothetical protein